MIYMHKETFDITQEFSCSGDISQLLSNSVNTFQNYFPIDDAIALPIQILNRKGYLTEACCSGHPFYNLKESYILFKYGIFLPTVPPGFTIKPPLHIYKYVNRMKCNKVLIRKNYDENDVYKLMRDVINAMEQLYKWVSDLPDFDIKDYGDERTV